MARLARTALRVEPLSDRITPAVTVTPGDDGVVTVRCDQRANDVQVTDNGAAGITLTVDGVDQTLPADLTTLKLYTRAGNDTVHYALGAGVTGTTRTVEVWLGNGHDTFTADLAGGLDAASDLTLRVDGGNGKDHLSATGGGTVAGHLTVEFKGNNGKDDLSFDFAGLVDATGVLDLTLNGGNGWDTIRGNLDVQAGSTGTVTAAVLGRNGKDDLGLWVAGDGLAGLAATSAFSIDGGHGRDVFANTDNVTILDPWHH
jgi:hypothetical protein